MKTQETPQKSSKSPKQKTPNKSKSQSQGNVQNIQSVNKVWLFYNLIRPI